MEVYWEAALRWVSSLAPRKEVTEVARKERGGRSTEKEEKAERRKRGGEEEEKETKCLDYISKSLWGKFRVGSEICRSERVKPPTLAPGSHQLPRLLLAHLGLKAPLPKDLKRKMFDADFTSDLPSQFHGVLQEENMAQK
ncbi:uncharacterized protein LOC143441231 [Arvicanthis niloticus]|uniref:uncharacterized protein LOC143311449 n=1 Tax=Arvicanthis niloticus TaxID=61156 RepID=UPI00402B7AED